MLHWHVQFEGLPLPDARQIGSSLTTTDTVIFIPPVPGRESPVLSFSFEVSSTNADGVTYLSLPSPRSRNAGHQPSDPGVALSSYVWRCGCAVGAEARVAAATYLHDRATTAESVYITEAPPHNQRLAAFRWTAFNSCSLTSPRRSSRRGGAL